MMRRLTAPRAWPSHALLAALETAALLLAVLGLAALDVLPRPGPRVVPGVPAVGSVSLAGHRVPVLVAPSRPGWNLVHIGFGQASVGTGPGRLVPATVRPGARNAWAPVWLPAGRSRLWIGHAGAVGTLSVDTGRAGGDRAPDLRGPDGPECATAALGRTIAAAAVPLRGCPADRLDPADAAALRAVVRFLAARGATTVGLVADSSPRGTSAAATVTQAARQEHLAVAAPGPARIPLIVVSGWAGADAAIREVGAGHVGALGTYLAPWLLNPELLRTPAGQLIPLRFDTGDPAALAYLTALAARFPDEPPTSTGYLGWKSAGPADGREVRLYAATAQILVPGVAAAHGGHGQGAARWLPQGAVTAVTGPLTDT
jgi:hypothetical protein